MASSSRKHQLEDSIRRFVQSASQVSDQPSELVVETFKLLFHTNRFESVPWRSHLNNDGAPVQLCEVTNHNGNSVRLLADPQVKQFGIVAPRLFANSVVDRLPPSLLPPRLREAFDCAVKQTLPPETGNFPELDRGILWLATDPSLRSLAIYLNMRWGLWNQRWMRVARWLKMTLPNPVPALRIVDVLQTCSEVASVGFESSDPQRVRAKLYFRLLRPTHLTLLGVPAFCSRRFVTFLSALDGVESLRTGGLVLSVSFALESGDLSDAKIDVCGHCLGWAPDRWVEFLERCRKDFELSPPKSRYVLAGGDCEVAFVGLGLTAAEDVRLNIYLKPMGGSDE